jgi:hypothetical protein
MLGGGGKLARRRIEQHAYIPYTHGCRRICDRLLTKRRLALRLKGEDSDFGRLVKKTCRKTYASRLFANDADAARLRRITVIIRARFMRTRFPNCELMALL